MNARVGSPEGDQSYRKRRSRLWKQRLLDNNKRWFLILVVAEAEFLSDFGEGVELGEEFVDGEVGDGEFTVFEGGCFGLSTDGDHGVHEVVVL